MQGMGHIQMCRQEVHGDTAHGSESMPGCAEEPGENHCIPNHLGISTNAEDGTSPSNVFSKGEEAFQLHIQ